MFKHVLSTIKNVRDFGPSILSAAIKRPDTNGYSSVNTRFGEFKVRRSETDWEVLRQIFARRECDLDRLKQGHVVRDLYEATLAAGTTPLIIDAGANVGFTARFFAASYPLAHIISIEPDPENVALCRENTKDFPNIEVIEAAVGAKPGHVSIARQAGNAWGSRTYPAESGIRIVTINELISARGEVGPIIVKIDIEGAELELFSGSTEWIDKTCAVVVEPHDWLFPGDRSSQPMQRAMLGTGRDFLILGENVIWMKPLTASKTVAEPQAPGKARS